VLKIALAEPLGGIAPAVTPPPVAGDSAAVSH
jgi:hypothetical protein